MVDPETLAQMNGKYVCPPDAARLGAQQWQRRPFLIPQRGLRKKLKLGNPNPRL